MIDGPTNKQKQFVEEYLKTFNASQAYRKVYDKPDRPLTEGTISVYSCQLLRKPKVKAYLEKRLEERKEETNLDINFLIKYLIGALATSPTTAYSKKSQQKYLTEVTLKTSVDLSKMGKKIDINALEPRIFPERIKTFSKEKAAEILAKYLDIDRTHLTASVQYKSDPKELDNLTEEELSQLLALKKKAENVQD